MENKKSLFLSFLILINCFLFGTNFAASTNKYYVCDEKTTESKENLFRFDKSLVDIQKFLSRQDVKEKIRYELKGGLKQCLSEGNFFILPIDSYVNFVINNIVARLTEMMTAEPKPEILICYFGNQNNHEYHLARAYSFEGVSSKKDAIILGLGVLNQLLVDGSPEDYQLRIFSLILILAHELGHHYLGHTAKHFEAKKTWVGRFISSIKDFFFIGACESRKNEADADAFAFDLFARCMPESLANLQENIDKVYKISQDILHNAMQLVEQEEVNSPFIIRKIISLKKKYMAQGFYSKHQGINRMIAFLSYDTHPMPQDRIEKLRDFLKKMIPN